MGRKAGLRCKRRTDVCRIRHLAPKGEFLFICEDSDYAGVGATPENYIRILTPVGKIADFAKNIVPGFETS